MMIKNGEEEEEDDDDYDGENINRGRLLRKAREYNLQFPGKGV